MREYVALPRAIGRILAEYALIFPLVYLLTGVLDAPMTIAFLFLVPGCAVLGALLRRFLPAGPAELGLCLGLSVAMTAVVTSLFAARINPANFVLPILVAPFAAVRGRQLTQHDWHGVLPNFVPCMLLVFDLVVIAFLNYTGRLHPFLPVIMVAGPVALVVGYYLMNTLSRRNLADDQRLDQAGGSTHRTAIPRNLAPQNRALVTGLLVLGGGLSFLPFLVTAATFLLQLAARLFGGIFNAILTLLRLLFPMQSWGRSEVEEVPPQEEMEYVVDDFWDAFFRIFMGIFFVLVMITLAILVVIAARKGWKLLQELFRKLAGDRGMVGADTLDFDDTSDSLFNLRDLPKKYWEDLKKKVSDLTRRTVRWSELEDEGERVKYLYRAALRRAKRHGYTHQESYTPGEALSSASHSLQQLESVEPELREQYNAVRYGEKEPAAGVAESIKSRADL